MLFSQHHKRDAGEVDRMERERGRACRRTSRATAFVARVFHWVMAFVDADAALHRVPADRRRQVRVGAVALDGGHPADRSIIFHIIHATFFLDFWSIWVGPKDIPEFKAEMMREIGNEARRARKPGKYPLGNRLYHLAVHGGRPAA